MNNDLLFIFYIAPLIFILILTLSNILSRNRDLKSQNEIGTSVLIAATPVLNLLIMVTCVVFKDCRDLVSIYADGLIKVSLSLAMLGVLVYTLM